MRTPELSTVARSLASGVAALVLAAHAPAAIAATASLVADRDNTLYQTIDGSTSNGAGPSLFAGRTGQGSDYLRRALIRFDVAGSIPAGATIVSAQLRLEVTNDPPGAGADPFELRVVDRDWGEGASVAGGDGGGGTTASTGDATWLHTFYATSFWNSEGGDFDGVASGSTSISGLGQHSIGSTAQMVADVQGWLDAPSSNHGWIVIGDETTAQSARRFDSREGGTPPELVLEYEPAGPVPATPPAGLAALAIALAAIGFTALRRRSRA